MQNNLSQKIENINSQLEVISSNQKSQEQNYTSRGNSRPPLVANNNEIKGEFDQFIRKGNRGSLITKSYTSNEDSGGVVIHPSLYNKIIGAINSRCPMRRLASTETISSGVFDLVIQEGGFSADWAVDGQERPNTDVPKLIKKKIYVHELYAQPKASQRLIDDSAINIESWLTENLRDSFSLSEEHAFINGDGNQKPKGILTCDSDKVTVALSDAEQGVSLEDLMNMLGSMNEAFLNNATFLMHRRTLSALQGLKDAHGRFIWQRSVTDKMSDTILGIPVICSDAMPTEDSPVILADFKAAYKIVERSGISILRDPYTDKPFVKFYAVKRVGGDVANENALRILRA